MEPEYNDLDEQVRAAARSLEEHGYAVIERIYSEQECAELTGQMWTLLEQASGGGLRRDMDFAKVSAKQLPPHKHGIMETYRLNHAELVRHVRRDPRMIRVFALLYGTDQLVGSMDRVNWKFPGRPYRSKGDWCHADQHPRKLGRLCIQSYLTVTAQTAESPANRFYDGSHLAFAEFFKARRDDGQSSDWTLLTDTQRQQLRLQCPLVKPDCPPGSLVLWDSRTVHSPSEGSDFSQGRFVIYLCYSPLWDKADDKTVLEKKQLAFTERRSTSHTPCPQKLFGKYAHTYGEKDQALMEIPEQLMGNAGEPTERERLLFGFRRYKKREGLLLGEDWGRGIHTPLLQFESPFNQPKRAKKTGKRDAAGDVQPRAEKKKRSV